MCCDAEDLPMVLSSVLERDGGALGAEGIPEGDAPAAVRLLAPPPRTSLSPSEHDRSPVVFGRLDAYIILTTGRPPRFRDASTTVTS